MAVVLACGPSVACAQQEAADGALAGQLDTLVPTLLSRHQAVGAAVAVLENGAEVLARGFGQADAARGIPFTDSTVTNVASVSKAVTAWGVLRAWRDGRLPLDRPVGDLLAGWSLPATGESASKVTVRRLLRHTGGLDLPSVPSFPLDATAPTLVEVLGGEAPGSPGVTIERTPGSAWSYSGGGYTLLELLIEERTGRPFPTFMRESVFSPLGLPDATFGPPDASPLVARGHGESGGSTPRVRYVGTSAAGLLASARDFARLLVAYHEEWRGGNAVLDSATVHALASDPVPVVLDGVSGAFYGLGHGVHHTRDGRVLLYHSGGNPGFRAYFIVDPASGDGLFEAVNSDNGVDVIARLRELWARSAGVDLPPLF